MGRPVPRDVRPSLDDIQPIFSRDVAGNHDVRARLDDGTLVCSCVLELHGETVRIWFEATDDELSNWALMAPADAYAIID